MSQSEHFCPRSLKVPEHYRVKSQYSLKAAAHRPGGALAGAMRRRVGRGIRERDGPSLRADRGRRQRWRVLNRWEGLGAIQSRGRRHLSAPRTRRSSRHAGWPSWFLRADATPKNRGRINVGGRSPIRHYQTNAATSLQPSGSPPRARATSILRANVTHENPGRRQAPTARQRGAPASADLPRYWISRVGP